MEVKPGEGDNKIVTVEELSEQIQNLNKGIAGYRDTASKAEQRAIAAEKLAGEAKAEADALKAKGDKQEPEKVEKLSPDDQKRLEQWAQAQGFVTKEEMEKERNRLIGDSVRNIEAQAIEEFQKSHPEYKEDDKWELVKKEFGQYKQPTSITAYRNILNKIYKELSGNDEAIAKERAKEETKKRLGLGGGSQRDADGSEMTLEKLHERYPNLSMEQIESRLEEINKLSEARAKKNAARKK